MCGIAGLFHTETLKPVEPIRVERMALEMARTHPKTIVAGLHPGTVDTELSKPFQSRLADSQLTSPDAAATNLLNVIDALEPSHSGKIFDWKGEEIPA